MLRHLAEAIGRRFLASAASLAASSFLAHGLGVTNLGQYAGMLALGQLAVVAFGAGLDLSPIYILRNHPGHARRIWQVSSLAALAAAALCCIFGVLMQTFSGPSDISTGVLSRWGALPFFYAGAVIMMSHQFACLQGLLRLTVYNFFQVTYPVLFLVYLVVIRAASGSLTPLVAMQGWIAISLVLAGGAAVATRVLIPADHVKSSGDVPPPLRALCRYSRDTYLANALGTLNARLPLLVAAVVLAPVASSQFAAVMLMNDVFSFFSLAIGSVTLAVLSAPLPSDERRQLLERACRINTMLTAAAVAVFLLMFDPLALLLLGRDLATPDLRSVAALVLGCTVLHSTARILCTDLSAQGRPLLNLLPNVPFTVVFLALFFLLPRLGVADPWVAAVSFTAGSLSFSVSTFLLHRQRTGVSLRSVLLFSRDDLLLAAETLKRKRRLRRALEGVQSTRSPETQP